MQVGNGESYDSELNLPAFCNEPWGNIDMGGDNYFVDMYGIQWVQDEHNILFPEMDDNEKKCDLPENQANGEVVKDSEARKIPPLPLPQNLSCICQMLLEVVYRFQKVLAIKVNFTVKNMSCLFHLDKAFQQMNMRSVQGMGDHAM